jgi:hypothetical protein
MLQVVISKNCLNVSKGYSCLLLQVLVGDEASSTRCADDFGEENDSTRGDVTQPGWFSERLFWLCNMTLTSCEFEATKQKQIEL